MAENQVRSPRFRVPSDTINLRKLEKETKKLLFLGFLAAVCINAALGAVFTYFKTDVKIMKPSTVEFIYVKPRMTKVLAVNKIFGKVRTYDRKRISVRQPEVEMQTRLHLPPTMQLKTELPEMEAEIAILQNKTIPVPAKLEYVLSATKEPDNMVSMREEMISLKDLDTGRYKAMVIQDPQIKQNIKGFIYIPTVWGTQLKPPDHLKRAVLHLAEAVNRYTNIEAYMDPHLILDSRKLHEMPVVYITTDTAFELTDIESRNLGEYLRNGGFAIVDNGTPMYEFGQAEASLRQMLRDALGADARFLPIPNSHPLYHCFFDFDDGPPIGGEIGIAATLTTGIQGVIARGSFMAKEVFYLEGIWLDNRLVAIYSDKGYATKWSEYTNNIPQLKMGVNMVVFALTQKGGIAQQRMELFTYRQ
ncbi:MAG: DUF4159 domain-containing protein [Candidatus Latescibacteria bacterium]|nr:DUF4159 domain-containing protein [Candidatus Latescibacterota bacterium]